MFANVAPFVWGGVGCGGLISKVMVAVKYQTNIMVGSFQEQCPKLWSLSKTI